MIISPDNYIYNSEGIYCWTPETAREAWRQAETQLKESCASNEYSAVAFLCGPPGSGKTTYLSKNQNPTWIYFDATLCAPKRRKHLLSLIKDSKLKKVCIFINTPIEVCLQRNDQRTTDRKVPKHTIDQMYASLVVPSTSEGFDQVITIDYQGPKPFSKASLPIKGKYFALVLTKESQDLLLTKVPAIHTQLFAHHVTLLYGPSAETISKWEHLVGEIVSIKCVKLYQNYKGQCITVEIPPKLILRPEQQHHITISCALDTRPAYSNELLKSSEGISLEEPLHLIGKFELI